MKRSIINSDRAKAMVALAEQQERHWPIAAFDITFHKKKKNHWMWFIFPQLAELGRSSTSKYYGFRDKSEIEFFVNSRTGDILKRMTNIVIDTFHDEIFDSSITGKEFISSLFPGIDYLKFLSCMTLFYISLDCHKDGELKDVCGKALDTFYGGVLDEKTVSIYKTLKP